MEHDYAQQPIYRRFRSAMSITVHGITKRQTNILTKMRQMGDCGALYDWMETLPPADEMEVDVLLELVQLTITDNSINCVSDLSIANALIEKARKKA